MTPFIDILLVLLVIFMTITPNVPTGLRTTIPQQPPPDPQRQERNDLIVLNVDKNGIVKINQDEVLPSQLAQRLREIFKSRNDRTVFVNADHSLLFNDVAQLIDVAKGAGIERVGLVTDQIVAK